MNFDQTDLLVVSIGAAIVFVTDLIGNSIAFNNRIVNALVTSILFAIIFTALQYFATQSGNPIW